MPQDAFTIYHTAKELNKFLSGARVDRINQPSKDDLTFFLRTDGKNVKLAISANAESARVSLTNDSKEAPLQAPSFCMLLRKHLSHAVIKEISAINYERIITILFETKNEMRETGEKILYCEIMGKYSNVTLTQNGIILGAMKQSSSLEGLRPIFPGVSYKLPFPQDKLELNDSEKVIAALTNYKGNDLSEFLFSSVKGLSKQTATEIAFRYLGADYDNYNNVKNIKIADFYKHLCDFYDTQNYKPNVLEFNNKSDFFICDYKSIEAKRTYFNTISSAVDFYFSNKECKKIFNQTKQKYVEQVKGYEKKLQKKLQIVLEKILSCKDMQKDRIFGELLIANLYRLKGGVESVELEDYYQSPPALIKIKLDKNLSPKENAERYFKKYNKAKKTLSAVEPQKVELENQLKYVNSLYDEIDLCEKVDEFIEIEEELKIISIVKQAKNSTAKKKKQAPNFRVYEYQGFKILAGKNNIQNDQLTMNASRTDLWLHTKDYHSAHVIIESNNNQIPNEVILYAAEICAFYSKASGSDKVPVDYTLKKFVKKTPGAKIGSVIYTNQKTILVTPNKH